MEEQVCCRTARPFIVELRRSGHLLLQMAPRSLAVAGGAEKNGGPP